MKAWLRYACSSQHKEAKKSIILRSEANTENFTQDRQSAVRYFFTGIFGSTERNKWKELNVIGHIMNYLCIPRGSRQLIVDVLDRCLDCG